MSRVNFREVAERFTHIDARFVACEVGLPENDGFFTVEFYPWWEHPLYLQARAAGANWEVSTQNEEALRPVTVFPKRVHQARLSQSVDVTDWGFTQNHPLLWQYEASQEITCNAPLSLEQWMQIMEAVRDKLTGHCCWADLSRYAAHDNVYRWGKSGSFSLGHFPRPLFLAIREALDERRIPYFARSEPKPVQVPVLFLIDEYDCIIADDFELEVPEFVHKPEWFSLR